MKLGTLVFALASLILLILSGFITKRLKKKEYSDFRGMWLPVLINLRKRLCNNSKK
jgi:hypothetical protein